MTGSQGYVSTELTHLVGRGEKDTLKPLVRQFEILTEILDSGRLERPRSPDDSPGIVIDFRKKDVFEVFDHPRAVCFCDIPWQELGIHMSKYGSVGLSFPKSFLVPKGASPIFYVARDSILAVNFVEGVPQERRSREALREFPAGASDLLQHLSLLSGPSWFLYHYVFLYMKGFDTTLDKSDPRNVYMEREWRVIESVAFTRNDIHRVILPREYIAAFNERYRDLAGKVTPAEDCLRSL
jgi:hypothetical protein